jgi:cytochrome c oxidase cbb3-type subunit 1
VAGITQGLMWREYGSDGYLVYSFVEVVAAMKPYYLIRVLGGLLYFAGALIMTWNIAMTIAGRIRTEAPMTSAAFDPAKDRPVTPPLPANDPRGTPPAVAAE